MRQLLFEIKENRPLTKDIMEMVLAGDTSDITRPGQFVNIKLDGLYLRRPISVCNVEADILTLIWKKANSPLSIRLSEKAPNR